MRIEEFRISIPEQALQDLQARLENTRFADDFANEDWAYGTNRDSLEAFVRHWRQDYHWREHEAEINRHPHFKTSIDGVPIHFMHRKGRGDNPIPIVLSHGWPWTFWDARKIIGPLTDPASYGGDPADAFDVVVPSLPGFGFSSPLRKPAVNATLTADLWHRLMTEGLGYSRYTAHGGDWGAFITAQIGHKYRDHVAGIHMLGGAPLDWLSRPMPEPSDYAEDEAGWYEQSQRFFAEHQGYMAIQSTRPQTLSYSLNDSPAGLCAWLLEKRRSWSDCGGDVERCYSKDELLTSVMLFWLTQTIGTSARYYYEAKHNPWTPSHGDEPMVDVPTGIIKLERDVCHWPRSIMERHFNVQRWTRSATGGHFAWMEEPELVVSELREFFRPLRND